MGTEGVNFPCRNCQTSHNLPAKEWVGNYSCQMFIKWNNHVIAILAGHCNAALCARSAIFHQSGDLAQHIFAIRHVGGSLSLSLLLIVIKNFWNFLYGSLAGSGSWLALDRTVEACLMAKWVTVLKIYFCFLEKSFVCIQMYLLYLYVSGCIHIYSDVFGCIHMYSIWNSCIRMYSDVFGCICMYPIWNSCIRLYPYVFRCIWMYLCVSGSRDQYSI